MMSIYVPAGVGAPPLSTQLQLWSFSMRYHYIEFVTGNVNIAFKVHWNIMSTQELHLSRRSTCTDPTIDIMESWDFSVVVNCYWYV